MKTLANADHAQEIEERIRALTADDQRRFGRMSVGEAVCHMRESYRVGLGELAAQPAPLPIPGPIIKFLALRVPLQWRPGVPTVREVDMANGACPLTSFNADQESLIAAHRRFTGLRDNRNTHPIFGRMTPSDWMRWGYLHADHHLRQFGR